MGANMSKIKYTLIFLISLFWLSACDKEQNNEPEINSCNPTGVSGALIQSTFILTITPDQVEAALSAYLPINYELDYSADVYSVTYNTRDKDDNLIVVSGAMFIPVGLDSLDLLSTQHGTTLKRTDVGSVNFYYAIDGLLMAMKGYLVVAPDYIGLGQSDLFHPYLHAQLSANPVIDMLRAARAYACDEELALSGRLFLSGYSEGGYVTLATQKIIETQHSDEFDLMGVSPMAGPYDLVGSTETLLNQSHYENPSYLAYMVYAYNDIYEWNRLNDIFQEPYASMMPELYNGTVAADSINSRLTTSIDSLFTQSFKLSFLAGEEAELESALVENSFEGWGPIAPVRLIHGTNDTTVPYANSEVVYHSMLDNGGVSVDLVPIYGADHLTAAFPAFIIAEQWFDSLRTAN